MPHIFIQKNPASHQSFLKCSLLATVSLLTIFAAEPSRAIAQSAQVTLGQNNPPSSSAASGQNNPPSSSAALGQNILPDSGKPKISFSIAPGGLYYFYQEYDTDKDNAKFMDITGAMGGFETDLKINFNPNGVGVLLIPFDIAVYAGTRLRYKGQDSDKPVYGAVINYKDDTVLFWTRSLIGPSIAFMDYYRINVLSGIGYKYTKNIARDDSQYFRVNNLLYLPLALQFAYSKDRFSVLLHGEYDLFLAGSQASDFIASITRFDDPSVYEDAQRHTIKPQRKGHGFRFYSAFNINAFSITPFVNYFWVENSDTIETMPLGRETGHRYPAEAYLEPRNITVEAGMKFGYQF